MKAHLIILLILSAAVEAFQTIQFVNSGRAVVRSKLASTYRRPINIVGGSSTELNAIPTEALTCFLPTCLGFYQSDYGVSYGYGTATALTSWLFWSRSGLTPSTAPWLFAHSLSVIFYGCRLNIFLFARERSSKKIQEIKARIEERSKARGPRWKRITFLSFCSLLYYCLCTPVQMALVGGAANPTVPALSLLYSSLVVGSWAGFVLAAIGDLQKTLVKRQKGEEHLVTSGLFRYLRHPNYTGEIIGWSCNALAGFVAIFMRESPKSTQTLLKLSAASLFGVYGIVKVLLRATANLENKQKENYGETPEYKEWIASSWRGIG